MLGVQRIRTRGWRLQHEPDNHTVAVGGVTALVLGRYNPPLRLLRRRDDKNGNSDERMRRVIRAKRKT